MITLRKNEDRRHVPHAVRNTWLTFYPPNRPKALFDEFVTLSTFNEVRLAPGRAAAVPLHENAEVITYVHQGSLLQEDSDGGSNVILAGQFQCGRADSAERRYDTNMSRTKHAHLFQICFVRAHPGERLPLQQKHFTAAERKGVLCLVASPAGCNGSLRLNHDARVYSAILDAGKHLCHQLPSGRSAWLHIVYGQARLGSILLTVGDGVGVTGEASVSLTTHEDSEILLVEVARPRA